MNPQSSSTQWQLTLSWTELGQQRTETISETQAAKTPGLVRLGRDPQQCDFVFAEEADSQSISRLHIEIFFKSDWQRFYLRNLKPNNPAIVDGGRLIEGEIALNTGNIIYLGHKKIEVVEIAKIRGDRPPETVLLSQDPPPSGQPEEVDRPVLFSPPKSSHLKCPNCGKILPADMRNSACTTCGHFLVDAVSIVTNDPIE
ncbi:FHA domain-containing protein [Oxynema sp. CENA135]|uniref:FHA domain-containing protein n=1 Tax=Oxynema sp. CENA135 TaxID=984206 RepID=UPI00190DCF00|nr:FHA domain-containing protein [Oxynema sp. CENA135]MBK4728334.1 FHA domain-containing protein [Oxynema sp. CENA135]